MPEERVGFERYPILANIECLNEIKILEENIGLGIEGRDLIANKKSDETLVLKISDKYTSVERCFRLFSNYEKEAYFDEMENVHFVKVYYYTFDEAIIIKNISSLCDAVEVISPINVREKVIKRIRKIA